MKGATSSVFMVTPFGKQFQSTLPMKGATLLGALIVKRIIVSIHAPNEGSDRTKRNADGRQSVSIHAPNEGSDVICVNVQHDPASFNPRSQ